VNREYYCQGLPDNIRFIITRIIKGGVHTMLKRSVFLILIAALLQSAYPSRISTVVFPLTNETGDALHAWIGCGFAETFGRKLQEMENFQVWDPVFLFQTDSSGYDMNADSTIKMGRNRWLWDVAIGGSYSVSNDTLKAVFRLIWATGKEEPLSVSIKHAGTVVDFFSFAGEVLFKVFRSIQYNVSPEDSAIVRRRVSCTFDAYRTFAAGYGFEMSGNNNAALSAYLRSEELDNHCALAPLRQGLILRKGNDFSRAGQAFNRAFSIDPDNSFIAAEYADFLVNCVPPSTAFKFINSHRPILGKTPKGMKAMGEMYVAAGELQRGIALLTKAVAFGPSDLDVELALGTAYSSAGDFTRAADIFNHLIQYRPYNVRYYASLGGAYRKAGRLMESTIVLESAEKIEPDNTMILVDLAHTYIRLGWYEKAGQLLLRAREIAPQMSDVSTNLGVVYWYQGKKAEAIACFEEAAKVATTRQAALNNLGNVLFMDGAKAKSIQAYRKADEAGRKNEVVLYNCAIACLEEKKLKKAASYFEEMLQLTPDRTDVLVRQASIAMTLKRYGAAEEYYRRIIELLPDHETALRGMVALLFRQKRYKDAVQPIEDYLLRQPLSREFMLLLASAYDAMHWPEVALMKYQMVMREFPDDSAGWLGAGVCMYTLIKDKGMQNYDDAILILKKASDLAVNNPLPDELIGLIYADYRGYRELAVDHWKKALQRATDRRTRKFLERRIAEKG
jgi:tetratricopeptide (TPR) repeat protein